MKLFTIEEANALLPEVVPLLRSIRELYQTVDSLRDDAKAAALASQSGGGMAGGTQYVNTLYEIGRLTTALHEAGVELKDHSRGLIDFPSERAGRIVYLCWQLDENEELVWWHETDAGFAGRQRL